MAYILKPNRTFQNRFDGALITTAYLIIDDLTINKQRREVRFNVSIYASRQSRVEGRDAIQSHVVVIGDPNFTTYFSPSANTKIWQQVENYLEVAGLPNVVIADWKKDSEDEPS